MATDHLARELQAKGVGISLLFGWDFRSGGPEVPDGVSYRTVSVDRKGIHEIGTYALLQFWVRGTSAIREMCRSQSYDLVHFVFSVPTGLLSFGLGRRQPYICSLRGIDVPYFMDESTIFQTVVKPLNRVIVKRARALVALSGPLRDQFQNWRPELEVTIIPNGIEVGEAPRESAYSSGSKRLVCVARLVRFKRLELLLDAFVELSRANSGLSLDVYGDGYLRKSLQERVDAFDGSTSIRLRGAVSRSVLRGRLPEYDVFVLPSISDSFGMVFLEAMAAGLPVIAADSGGPREIVGHEQTGILIPADDRGALVAAMQYAVDQPRKMAEFGQAGFEKAKDEFRWASVADEYLEVYRAALAAI